MQIKETMQRYGFTPTSLAKKMGVYASTVIRLTEGNPTVDKLDELARWIGCSRWEFFADEIRAAGFEVVKASAEQQETDINQLPFGSPSAGGATREGQSLCADADATAHGDSPCVSPAMQQAIICPHCKRAIAITVNGI